MSSVWSEAERRRLAVEASGHEPSWSNPRARAGNWMYTPPDAVDAISDAAIEWKAAYRVSSFRGCAGVRTTIGAIPSRNSCMRWDGHRWSAVTVRSPIRVFTKTASSSILIGRLGPQKCVRTSRWPSITCSQIDWHSGIPTCCPTEAYSSESRNSFDLYPRESCPPCSRNAH